MKTLKTSKKFYNKWLYKVTINLHSASMFRIYSLSEIRDICLNKSTTRLYGAKPKTEEEATYVLDLVNYLETLDPKSWSKRSEWHNIDFYTNDQYMYDDLSINFKDIVIHRSEPSSANIDTLDQNKVIVTTKLPHNKYNYRVYLNPHKLKGDTDSKKKYLDWLIAQAPRITCTDAVQRWFLKTDWNWDRRYVLVEDEGTLLMLKLRNPEVVGSVYNYVISDK